MQRDIECGPSATTSRAHTAIKIAPNYAGPVVYVPDASRSVGVCSDLLSDERAARYIEELKADYEQVRTLHASKKATPLVTLAQARANKHAIDWSAYQPPVPKFIGRRVFRNHDLAELAACIDWTPFFQTWDLAGRFPDILRDEVVGDSATRVFSDGKRLLQRLIEGRWLQANGVDGATGRLRAALGGEAIVHHAYFSSRRAWSDSRARWTRILRAPTVVPSRSAISSYDRPSTCFITKASRRLALSWARARSRSCRSSLRSRSSSGVAYVDGWSSSS